MKNFFNFLLVLVALGFGGCVTKYEKISISEAEFERQNWDAIDGFRDDNLTEALEVFKKGCEKSKSKVYMKEVCDNAKNASNGYEFFVSNFIPMKIVSSKYKDGGLITGYYEPLLRGSLQKSEIYKYPVLKTPNDLISINMNKLYPELSKYKLRGKLDTTFIKPYLSREEIEKNIDNFEPICYVDDKIDLYFLQVQGSGKITLDNNQTINVGYDNQNGHPYNSLGGRLMKEFNWTAKDVSMQSIREWAKNSQEAEVDKILNLNPSYIFFAERDHGARGSLGVDLVALRNVAVDIRYTPLGLPLFLVTQNPNGNPIKKVVVAADTGGAIKGEIRADYFFGFGDDAGSFAGTMKQKGQMILFIPKQILEGKK